MAEKTSRSRKSPKRSVGESSKNTRSSKKVNNSSSRSKGTRIKKDKSKKNKPQIYEVPIKTDDYIELDLGPVAIFLGLVAFFVISGIVIAYTGTRKMANTQKDTTQQKVVKVQIGEDTPVKGEGPVTIIEFSDFECPFCKQYSTTTYKKIIDDYVSYGKVQYAFRHFVAVPAHNPASTIEAKATICADNQGKFWEMHDYIFENTESNGKGIFGLGYDKNGKKLEDTKAIEQKLIEEAEKMGLNKEDFKTCLASDIAKNKFEADNSYVNNTLAPAAQMAGYQGLGTPLFAICKTPQNKTDTCDAELIIGAYPYETFQSKIDEFLK